ncbi:choice-of-anchor R domain-containing protein [Microcystis sp. M061S2]|uniref:choice-of-anchor R domain-containing protein n=1 Tax=Microcystis sp. M061S2 TaxID=2771171 RepID=UPI00258F14C2|nr:choice-of-anchor R domain-containing protein [Microcystis sp. M061S2]MCA2652900.1 hypothetical protein [Microcystis sp. M061S2]
MLNFNYYDQPGTASSAGVFIPRDNIAGLVEDEELNIYQPAIIKDCKFLSGFLITLESSVFVNTALGLSIEKSNLIGGAGGVFNQIFSINIAESVDYSTRIFYSIPTPIIGANVGLGALKIIDVFPSAASVSNQGAISTAGILIPHSELNFYGASSQNPNSDSRQWFAAVIRYLFDKITIRENTTTEPFSALIGKSLGNFNRFSLPTNALDSTNPTTGLNPVKVIDTYSRIIEFNIQYALSEKTQTFDVRNHLNPPVNIPIITFVDNLPPVTISKDFGIAINLNQWVASTFVTGNNNVYSLNSISLRFRADTLSNNLILSLHSDNAGGVGNQIIDFVNPIFNTGIIDNYLFTLTTPQPLTSNTTYWLIAKISSGEGVYSWRLTDSTDQMGQFGWLIGNFSYKSNNQGLTWDSLSEFVTQFSVKGS